MNYVIKLNNDRLFLSLKGESVEFIENQNDAASFGTAAAAKDFINKKYSSEKIKSALSVIPLNVSAKKQEVSSKIKCFDDIYDDLRVDDYGKLLSSLLSRADDFLLEKEIYRKSFSAVGKKISNIYHAIENENFNGYEGWKYMQELKDLLQKESALRKKIVYLDECIKVINFMKGDR